jgi:hypothetical protein
MKNLFPLLALLLAADTHAQHLSWAETVGSAEWDYGWSVTTDAAGNVYATGSFGDVADFDPGSGVLNLTPSGGSDDIFIQKLSPQGALIWAKRIGGTLADEGRRIHLDSQGNIYVSGTFRGTVDFNPGAPVFNLVNPNGTTDAGFLLKLNPNGGFAWARQFESTGTTRPQHILTDSQDNVLVAGTYQSATDFDLNAGTFNLPVLAVLDNMFFMKIDSTSQFIWAKGIKGSGSESIRSMDLDQDDNLYATGYMAGGTTDFDPDAGVAQVTAASDGTFDSYVLKLSVNGNFVWVRHFNGTGASGNSVTINRMHVATDGIMHMAGDMRGMQDLDPGAGTDTQNALGYNAFYLKLDTAGNHVLGKVLGSGSNFYGDRMCRMSTGDVYVMGFFQGAVDFDPGPAVLNLPVLGANGALFIMRITDSGDLVSVKQIGGAFSQTLDDLAIDPADNLLLTGTFRLTMDMDPDTSTVSIASASSYGDAYVIRLDHCDIAATTTTVGATITATEAGLAYQWFDCLTSAPVAGATDQSFSPVTNGSYAVEVTANGCTVMSDCIDILTVGVGAGLLEAVRVAPNPGNGLFSVHGLRATDRAEVLDMLGRTITDVTTLNGTAAQCDLRHAPKGVYLLRVTHNGQQTTVIRLLVQ